MRRLALLILSCLACLSMSVFAQSTTELFAETLTGLDDAPVALAQWRGKPLIVNFWARWCGPCRREIPAFIELRKEYRSRGLEILGIALEDKAEPVRDFAKTYEMDYPLLLAQNKGFALMKALGNTKMGLPFTVAIDRQGKIAVIKMGLITAAELTQAAETVLR